MDNHQVEALISLISYKKNITEREICLEVGDNEDYISQQRSRGRFTKPFINKLTERYADVIASEQKAHLKATDVETVIYGIAARQRVHGLYLAEIFALEKGTSVAKIVSEMEALEKESVEALIKAKS